MIQILGQSRVLFSRDGKHALQVVSVRHDYQAPSVTFEVRAKRGGATSQIEMRVKQNLDLQLLQRLSGVTSADSLLCALATWLLWHQLDEASREAGHPFVPQAEPYFLDYDIVRIYAKPSRSAISGSELQVTAANAVEISVAMSTRFGLSAVVDELVSSFVRCTYEELRGVVMEGKDTSWSVNEDRKNRRLELDALGGFRASRGLLESFGIVAALSAPRYHGVLPYWQKAIGLRVDSPSDAAGSIANAAHAAEALARIVTETNDPFGDALKRMKESGRITEELFNLGRTIHGRTSGAIGVRHGAPSGPTADTRDADLYLGLFASVIGQLLIADRRETP